MWIQSSFFPDAKDHGSSDDVLACFEDGSKQVVARDFVAKQWMLTSDGMPVSKPVMYWRFLPDSPSGIILRDGL